MDASTYDVDAPPCDVDAPTYDVDAPPNDVDAPIPQGRAPMQWEGSTHTVGRMHPSRWGTHPPPTSGRPC